MEFRQLFLAWVQRVCRAKELPEEVAAVAGGEVGRVVCICVGWVCKWVWGSPITNHHPSVHPNPNPQVYIMGSYKLNVHEPGADIDLCCVVPMHVGREDFFGSLQETLRYAFFGG